MEPYINLHTHLPEPDDEVISVYNLLLNETSEDPGGYFSAGLHPWYADQLLPGRLSDLLNLLATNSRMIAIGETGLDTLCKVPFRIQQDVFELHLRKAEEFHLPVVIHCVKAWDEVIEMSSGYPVIKILHGYSGSPALTGRLVKSGFCFSVGKAILNPSSKIHQSVGSIPAENLFCETDTSGISVQAVYSALSAALHVDEEELRCIISGNFSQLRSRTT